MLIKSVPNHFKKWEALHQGAPRQQDIDRLVKVRRFKKQWKKASEMQRRKREALQCEVENIVNRAGLNGHSL